MVHELNPAQKKAVEAPPGPLLIVAGAGTGKTRTLTERILYLIRSGIPPENICAITFTNKAAREMEERVARNFQFSIFNPQPYIGTFHALGASILRKEARHFGRTPSFTIFDDHDSSSLMKKIWKSIERGKQDDGEYALSGRGIRSRAAEKEGPAFYASHASALKNGAAIREKLSRSSDPREQRALVAFDRYEAALEKSNAFDFDDLIEKVVRLWRERPEILEKYRRRYPHLLVDEFQDVNRMQYEFVRLLAGGAKQLSVVGDDQQLIYGWRYASIDLFLGFERDWPGTSTVRLEENYRSTATIIEAASALIAQNRRQKPKKLWTRNPAGEPIVLAETEDEEAEAGWIADTIFNLQFSIYKNAEGDGAKPETAAILYRTNAQSRPIEQSLIERGIPYRIYGGLKFYERKEIKDIVAAVRLAVNPADEMSRDRWENSLPKSMSRGLGTVLARGSALPPRDLIAEILDAAHYLDYLDRNFGNADERKENMAELIHFAGQFTDTATFLERASLVQATDDPETRDPKLETRNPVHLSTIHLAKGLEFDRVFIAGAAEGILPHTRSLSDPGPLEEERRLMYVAMTRARKTLAISFFGLPSRFLSELPEGNLRYKNLAGEHSRALGDEERYITID